MPVFKFSEPVNIGRLLLFQKVAVDGVAGPELLGTGDITVSTVGLFGAQIGELLGTGDIVVAVGVYGQAEPVLGTGEITLSGKVGVASFAQPKMVGEITLPGWQFIGVSGDATLNGVGNGALWVKPSMSGRAGARGSLPCFSVGVSGFGTKEVLRTGAGHAWVATVGVSGAGTLSKAGSGDIAVPSSIFGVGGNAVLDGRSVSTITFAALVGISGFGQDYTYERSEGDDAVLRYEDRRRRI